MAHLLLHSERMDVLLSHAAGFVRTEAAAGEVLLIGATSEAADDFARGLCDSAIAGIHRLTTRRLAAALAQSTLTARGIAPASAAVRVALAARIVDAALAAGSLIYFAPVAAT
ncbi:MAG: hypothetical protein ABIZ80_15090, partial [Bryobacteraceae bacterium]